MTERVFQDDSYARRCEARIVAVNDLGGVVLDRTVFYPTGGGQPGDSGRLILSDGRELSIAAAIKGEAPGEIVHVPDDGQASPRAGESVTAEIDWTRRYTHMRMHTCLHLLSAVLPYPVTGGQVGAEKSRLDFNLPDPPAKEDIEKELNRLITEDHPVSFDWITDEALDAQPELVKTMSVAPPRGAGLVRLIRIEACDLQPCGGTHVARTGEIGAAQVLDIKNKGKQNRRVTVALAS